MIDICTKNEADPDSGLGEVCETSHRQTDEFTLLQYRYFCCKTGTIQQLLTFLSNLIIYYGFDHMVMQRAKNTHLLVSN